MRESKKGLALWLCGNAALLFGALAAGSPNGGLSALLIAQLIFTALLVLAMLVIRFKIIPRFTLDPGRFQLALETVVGAFIRKPKPKPVRTPAQIRAERKEPGLGEKLRRFPGAVGRWASQNRGALAVWLAVIAALLAGIGLTGSHGEHGDVRVVMRDAVLHDTFRISLFSLKEVNPALIAAMTVSSVLIVAALLIRLLVIPRFREVPGRFQMILETIVGTLDGMAGVKSDEEPRFIGGYVFAAGVYIFVSTLFELFGIQAVAVNGHSVALPAPLSDVNAAIAMGCLSYLVIFFGGLIHAGGKGAGAALKEFSLPISMSFRLFGALLSGLLVTELVYHYVRLSYVLPVIVGVMFTMLHALVQAYVLTMLVGMYYGEVTEAGHEE